MTPPLEEKAGPQPPVTTQIGTIVSDSEGLVWVQSEERWNDSALTTMGHEEWLNRILPRLGPSDAVDPVFWDIGAHAGLWSLRLANRGFKVVAVEPLNVNRSLLMANLALNMLGERVRVLEVAAWDETGHEVFLSGDPLRAPGHAVVVHDRPDEASAPVTTARLDEVLQGDPFPDVVKIDVEGFEHRVLDGLTGVMEAGARPDFLIEMHFNLDDAPEAEEIRPGVKDFMDSYGYRTIELLAGSFIPYWLCRPEGSSDP